MPVAKLKAIREVSSEDSTHKALNIITPLPGKKWKTETCGLKSAHIILELEEEQQIVGLDIGNEHSAFIEVMVSHTGCSPTDFVDLLITCSFMTPIESKNSDNVNRVRCFAQEALVQETLKTKWKFLKVICTQPFNKHVQYGLAFLKVHVVKPNVVIKKPVLGITETEQNKTIAKLVFREESPETESTLFDRWKQQSNSHNISERLSDAGKKRETIFKEISNAKKESSFVKTKQNPSKEVNELPKLMRNNNAVGVELSDAGKKTESILKGPAEISNVKKERSFANTKQNPSKEVKEHPKLMRNNNAVGFDKKTSLSERERDKDTSLKEFNSAQKKNTCNTLSLEKTTDDVREYRQFNQLLRGVVLVISGIQNPDRSNIRSKALAMGAKYRPNWEKDSTHLICQFKNTPKYNQVLGKGKIVSRGWIEDCYKEKKYLPWRRYALDSIEAAKEESDEEIFCESLKRRHPSESNASICVNNLDRSSSLDTDDEIQQVTKKRRSSDVYEVSTDEESYLNQKTTKEINI